MTNIHINFRKENSLNTNSLKIKFKGLIFYKNIINGKDSLYSFFRDFKENWLNNLEELKGNFILYIKEDKTEYIFTDNSGMSRLYYFKESVFESFIDLINYYKFSLKDIDYSGIVEFIQYGYNIFHTNIKSAKILKRNEMIVISNKLQVKEKKLSNLFAKKESIEEFFQNLKGNLNDEKIVCDLTAGIDSRMNLSLLKGNDITFKTCISGEKNHIDVTKCLEISKLLNLDTLYYPIDAKISKELLEKIYRALDGQYSIIEFYKNYILTEGLINDKINVRISGAAGELYKYSWYAQDLPFFNKKNFTLDKVYQKRYYSRGVKYDFYSDKFQNEINKYQKELKNNLEKYREENNVKTYDKLCYETIMRYGISTQLIPKSDDYIRYCPLFELSVVKNGINLKTKDRILYNLHRKIITKYTPEISKIKTNKGLTVNNSFIAILKDGLKLFVEFLTKIKNRILKKQVIIEDTANSHKIYDFFKENDEEYFEILKNNSIIKANFKKEDIDNRTYSRLITVAIFIKKVSENAK